jgi:hypothetical protein
MCADIPVAATAAAAGCAVAGAVAVAVVVMVVVDRIFCTQDPEFLDFRGYDTIPILHAMAKRLCLWQGLG